MKRILKISLLLILPIYLATCIDPVDFEPDQPENILIVDGYISTDTLKHKILLRRSDDLKNKIFPNETGASIRLFDENGEVGIYNEIAEGEYELEEAFAGIVGNSYHIEIQLESGTIYRSRPEKIAPPFDLTSDDLSIQVLWEEFVAPNRNIQIKPFVKLFVDFSIPEVEEGPYLRWTVDHIYAIEDLSCGGADPAEVCYIRPPNDRQDIQLFAGEGLVPGSNFKQEISKRFVDYAFGLRYSFSVKQFIHTKEAFQYWTQVDLIANQSGSIFDAPPGRIAGNIYNPEDEEELVLGYFAGVSVDTAHQFVIRADVLPEFPTLRPLCGLPGLRPWPFPEACCFCIIHEYSSMDRPDFWW